MRLIAKKPPVWVIDQARKASDLLHEPIKTQSDWLTTKRLMEVNHLLMQLFGYWRRDEGFQEFRGVNARTLPDSPV